MTDIAKLGLEIETKGADEATRKLSELEQAAKKAADGADKLNDAAGEAQENVSEVGQSAERSGNLLERLGIGFNAATIKAAAAAAAAKAFYEVLRIGLTEYAAYERATVQLSQSLERVGNSTGMTISQLQEFAGSLESATGVAEESILRMAQTINRSGRASGEEFKRLTKLSLDLAAAMGGDPVNAAEQLSRALTDPERAMGMLRRSFADFDPVVADAIERLAQAGETAKATEMLIGELEQKVGGSAAAATDTLSGAWARFTDALGDGARALVEVTGVAAATKAALEALTWAINTMADGARAAVGILNALANGLIEAGKGALGFSNDVKVAEQGMRAASIAALVLQGRLMEATAQMVAFDTQRRAMAAQQEAQDAAVERMRAGWTKLSGAVRDGADYFRRLGAAIQSNRAAEEQEIKLTQMSTKERQIAEAGITAYERAKRSLTQATGRFGAAEQAEAERVKEAAESTARLNQQLREVEQGHQKAARAAESHAKRVKELKDPMKELVADLDSYILSLEREAELAGMSGTERDKRIASMRIEDMITRELKGSNEALKEQYGARAAAAIDAADKASAAAQREADALRAIEDANMDAMNAFTDFASSVLRGSEDAGEALGNLLIRLLEIYAQMQIMQAMSGGGSGGGFLGSLLGGIFGGFGGEPAMAGSTPEMWGISRGGVFSSGEIIPFARGGTVERPTMRAMALMGEAGPEAVLPLRRDRAGNLGVGSMGGGDDVKVVVQNIDQRKSGAPVETQQTRGQNGEIVIRNYIRDEVRRALSDGSLDKDLSKNFNLGRNPTRRS
jgi:hypothetical protein